ncbi:hypothetical protein SAMN05216251_13335 [Actinacidiphila alni]|uniref:Uncharacterized protein n=2 Tax=Actinacidiphila alni TaxID=380248 RepID=A0A1I2M849_9ACTN|nr:hypothetical protein SAMN05216251_13335 [Actinacidiphila alni]
MASRGRHDGTDASTLNRQAPARPVKPKPKKKRRQLTDEEAARLVADWNGGRGAKQKELATRYDIALATVERIIKRHRERS